MSWQGLVGSGPHAAVTTGQRMLVVLKAPSLADRVAVLYRGHIMGVVERQNARVEELGLMMAGAA